jgi:hypothetical protein
MRYILCPDAGAGSEYACCFLFDAWVFFSFNNISNIMDTDYQRKAHAARKGASTRIFNTYCGWLSVFSDITGIDNIRGAN